MSSMIDPLRHEGGAAAGRAPTRRWVLLGVVTALLGLIAPLVSGPVAPVAAQQVPDDAVEAVAPAVESLQQAVDAVVAAEAAKAEADALLIGARAAEDRARQRSQRATRALDEQRRRYGELGAASYVRHGVASTRDHHVMVAALTARKQLLSEARAEHEAAEASFEDALTRRGSLDRAAAAAESDRAEAEALRQEREAAADVAMTAVGATDLPAVAYLAYRRAADAANAADPDCALAPAIVAAYGRFHWSHGRPSPNAVLAAPGAPPAGDPLGPYDLEQAATPVAHQLCAGDRALDQHGPLQSALYAIELDSAHVRIILATARRYARLPGLVLGTVPSDPAAVSDGVPQFDDGSPPLGPGDVQGMIDWAMTRLGTPYSQCLGPDARPQDPICPPGTSRFGAGFFDCSGFVSSAYRRIGLSVPATTYAMEADPTFMATKVASGFDLTVLRPGDVFLMDGHTGMYVGDGRIVHASGGGLTLEPVPRWVAHATFAVLRPVDLLGTAPD